MWQKEGFAKRDSDVTSALNRLEKYLGTFELVFASAEAEKLTVSPAPGKWSPVQVLGHLIDSAINNLKRFTEIQFSASPYVIVPYNQDKLVEVNHYQRLPLSHLLELWKTLNRQILFVCRDINDEKLQLPVDAGYENRELRTLGWIIADYIAHFEHHLQQIETMLNPAKS